MGMFVHEREIILLMLRPWVNGQYRLKGDNIQSVQFQVQPFYLSIETCILKVDASTHHNIQQLEMSSACCQQNTSCQAPSVMTSSVI